MFLARPPRAPLDRSVTVLWVCRQASGVRRLERVLPTATAQLVINLAEDETRQYDTADPARCIRASGAVVCGPRTGHAIIDTDEQADVVGVCFTPTGLLDVIAADASCVAGQDVALGDLWGERTARRLREQLLEVSTPEARLDLLEAALHTAWRARRAHPSTRYGVATLVAHPDVARIGTIAAAAGVSQRHFIERFTREVGITPKRFARVQRFQQALQRAHAGRTTPWGVLAADCGFADQAHLVHEFREFSGVTPTMWERLRTRHHNHVRFLQDAATTGLEGSAA